MAKGSCLCGTVTFSVSEEGRNMTHCHCSMCRKIHGALFATYYTSRDLVYTSGEEAIGSYQSSPGFQRAFCSHCGSTLPERSLDGDEAEVYVPAGLMDDDPGVRPEAHIFTESRADYYTITDALPQMTHYGDDDPTRVIETQRPPAREGKVSGGCLCGAVAFEYAGTPKMVMNCHCSRCRKAKGAAHATNAFVAGDQFVWTQGEGNITDYAHAGAKVFGHAFCKTCGSSLPRPRADGSVYNVPVGSLDQSPGIDAKGHIFVASKAPWFELTGEETRWDERPD